MHRISFSFVWAVLSTGLLNAADLARPNILMIAVDDLRPMLGCYGDARIRTPHIDRLAGGGMVFERAYCNYAKCGPSRLSLMTGLRPGTVGVYSHRDSAVKEFRKSRPDIVPLSRWFRESGYDVRSFGKIDHDGWAVASDWSAPPFAGREGEMLEVVEEVAPTSPSVIAERTACPVMQSPDVGDEHLFAGRMTEEVIRQMKEGDSDKPRFFAVGFRRPHLPFVAPKRYFDLYQPDESWLASNPEPPLGVPVFTWFNSDGYVGMSKRVGEPMPDKMTRADGIAFNGFEMRSYLGVPYRGELSTELQLSLLQAYAACVSYVDAQVGRLLDQLEQSGERENTIVLLWSDHGWHLGEQSAWGKMTNFEIATRVPLIVSVPGKSPGRTRSLAELVDVFPTLCDLVGIEGPSHLEGSSLVPVLDDPRRSIKDSIQHEYVRYNGRYMGKAIRTERYRYVCWTNRKGEFETEELYDLQTDPLETENVAGDNAKTCEQLRNRLN